jgi:hypothetical protein
MIMRLPIDLSQQLLVRSVHVKRHIDQYSVTESKHS